jgi:multidrug resistance efflux pump
MMKAKMFLAAAVVLPALILAGCTPSSTSSGTGGGTQAAAATPAGVQGGSGQGGQRVAGAQGGAGGQGAGAQAAGGRRFATIAVQAVVVHVGPLVTDNDTAGTVMPVTQSQVAAQVSGVVLKILHKAGDFVRAGAPVVQLDDAALKLAVQNAQASLDNAKINLAMGQQNTSASNPKLQDQLSAAQGALNSAQKTYNSQKALYDLGGISSSQLDNAKSALDQAQANVEAAKAALDVNNTSDTQNIAQLKLSVDQATNQLAIAQLGLRNATISAPFDGQIAAVNVSPGSFVSTNTAAFVLVSADKQINFTEPPTDAPSFRIGDSVLFNLGGKSYTVKIMQTPSAPINGVVPMVASVPASLPVAYGSVGTVTYRLTIATGPQIPISALQSRANINFVDTVVNNKAVEVPITIIDEAGTTAVVQGVNDGDQVIINPPPGLLNGATVQVVALPGAAGQGAGTQPAAGSAGGRQAGGQTGGQTGGRTGGQQTGTGTSSGQRSGQRTGGGQTSGAQTSGSGTTTQPTTGGTQ